MSDGRDILVSAVRLIEGQKVRRALDERNICGCFAALWFVNGVLASPVGIEFALFVALPFGSFLALGAASAQRRADSILSRSLAAHLIEHGTTELAEAA